MTKKVEEKAGPVAQGSEEENEEPDPERKRGPRVGWPRQHLPDGIC